MEIVAIEEGSLNLFEVGDVLRMSHVVNHFELVNPLDVGDAAIFGGDGYPINQEVEVVNERTCAVGLNLNELTGGMELVDERGCELQCWLSSGDYHMTRRILGDFGNYFLLRHGLGVVVLSVAKIAIQVTAGEADEYGRGAGEVTLSLQRVEYFIYFHCGVR